MPHHDDPTPAEIAAATEEIRSRWSDDEHLRRAVDMPDRSHFGQVEIRRWRVPLVKIEEIVQAGVQPGYFR